MPASIKGTAPYGSDKENFGQWKMVRKINSNSRDCNIPRVFILVGKISVLPKIFMFHFFELGPSFQKKDVLKNDLRML